jgi:lysyl-tRNA synthetase class 2
VKEEELDPTQYTENRKAWIQSVREAGQNPYPHKFKRTHKLNEFHTEWDPKAVEKNVFFEEANVAVTGRVMAIRF